MVVPGETLQGAATRRGRLRTGLDLIRFLAAALAWLVLARTRLAGPIRARGLDALLRATGTRLSVIGEPAALPGVLFVANHISWLDIAALARVTDAGFVAKSEVAGWPLLGALARRAGSLFVARGRVRQASMQAAALRSALARGRCYILFAEGTTGLGRTVLPFKSSLFPGDCEVAVQPVALVYRDERGALLDDVAQRAVAWLGDDALLPHAWALMGSPPRTLEIRFEAPFHAASRKDAALLSRAAIAARIASDGHLETGGVTV